MYQDGAKVTNGKFVPSTFEVMNQIRDAEKYYDGRLREYDHRLHRDDEVLPRAAELRLREPLTTVLLAENKNVQIEWWRMLCYGCIHHHPCFLGCLLCRRYRKQFRTEQFVAPDT